MPRFIPSKWRPWDDSSPGLEKADPERVVLRLDQLESKESCPCGCGEFPMGEKTTFMMGHDARLRGVLIRAHLMDVEVRYVIDGIMCSPQPAMRVAEGHGWREYLDGAVLRREGKNREVARRAMASKERLLKLGRWDYTGQVLAVYRSDVQGKIEIEYVDRAGNVRRKRLPVSEIPITEEQS